MDVRALTLPSDKLTPLLDLLQYVSTGNSITLQPTFKDFLFDSWEKGSSTSPWSQASNTKHRHAWNRYNLYEVSSPSRTRMMKFISADNWGFLAVRCWSQCGKMFLFLLLLECALEWTVKLMNDQPWQIHNPELGAAARKLMASGDHRGP